MRTLAGCYGCVCRACPHCRVRFFRGAGLLTVRISVRGDSCPGTSLITGPPEAVSLPPQEKKKKRE